MPAAGTVQQAEAKYRTHEKHLSDNMKKNAGESINF